jgi:hypothetical protein
LNCEMSGGLVRIPMEKRGRIPKGVGIRMASAQHQYPCQVLIAVHRPTTMPITNGQSRGLTPSTQHLPVLE